MFEPGERRRRMIEQVGEWVSPFIDPNELMVLCGENQDEDMFSNLEEIRDRVGAGLIAIRKGVLGISQIALAKEMGLSYGSSISRIELGTRTLGGYASEQLIRTAFEAAADIFVRNLQIPPEPAEMVVEEYFLQHNTRAPWDNIQTRPHHNLDMFDELDRQKQKENTAETPETTAVETDSDAVKTLASELIVKDINGILYRFLKPTERCLRVVAGTFGKRGLKKG